jgi:hypothetical protein
VTRSSCALAVDTLSTRTASAAAQRPAMRRCRGFLLLPGRSPGGRRGDASRAPALHSCMADEVRRIHSDPRRVASTSCGNRVNNRLARNTVPTGGSGWAARTPQV